MVLFFGDNLFKSLSKEETKVIKDYPYIVLRWKGPAKREYRIVCQAWRKYRIEQKSKDLMGEPKWNIISIDSNELINAFEENWEPKIRDGIHK